MMAFRWCPDPTTGSERDCGIHSIPYMIAQSPRDWQEDDGGFVPVCRISKPVPSLYAQ
jgi:hypothetical protein